MTTDQAIARQAAHENLITELTQALQTIVDRFGPSEADYIFSKRSALQKARAALAKARGAKQ